MQDEQIVQMSNENSWLKVFGDDGDRFYLSIRLLSSEGFGVFGKMSY